MLTLLAVLALPLQTAAHKGNGTTSLGDEHRGPAPPTPLSDIIQWIRIYKNPKRVPRSELDETGENFDDVRLFRFDEFGITGLHAPLNAPTFPSPGYNLRDYDQANPDYDLSPDVDIYWIQFHPTNHLDDPGGLIDEGDNSGLVTATDNTSVKVGDRVAIAIRVKNLGVFAAPDIAIGPPVLKAYVSPTSRNTIKITTPRSERKWRLSPNLPMIRIGRHPQFSNVPWPVSVPAGTEHTLVYHFEVTADHAADLNADGAWLKHDFVPYVPFTGSESDRPDFPADWPFDGRTGSPQRIEKSNLGPPGNLVTLTRVVNNGTPETLIAATGFEWLYDDPAIKEGTYPTARNSTDTVDVVFGHPDHTSRPSPTSLKPFNTFLLADYRLIRWGVYGYLSGGLVRGWAFHRIGDTLSRNHDGTAHTSIRNRRYDLSYYSHYHVPRYDPADKPHIFYPKLERPDTPATTAIEVPGGTQTGAFTVTLSFSDNGVFEGHDTSDTSVAAFKAALTDALAPWTVTALTYAGGIQTAASNPSSRALGGETRYSLTLSPPLGMKGEVPLQIPADMVMDVAESGNLASASVMVSVDSPLQLAEGKSVEIPEPEGGAYLADDALEVLVPFAEAGLTYEGENPPYLTIYLGKKGENPRHATWQQGEETEGSTVVPFRYTIAATDPIVSSVTPDTTAGVLIPTGTKLKSRSGRSSLDGTDEPAMASGKKAPVPDATEKAGFATSTGAAVTSPEVEVQVLPAVYLPPTEESAPKAGMSSIPRSPIVFNELGNGSGDTNDWLELRNVTGDAVSLKDWELSVVQDGKKEDTSLVAFTTDVSVPAEGLLLITNSDPTADGNLLAGGDDITTAKAEVKGSSHLYLVNAGLSLPDDGKFLLILRKAKEKRGLNEAFVDVAGGGGSGTDAFVREQEGDYDTYVWPLQVLEAPGSATEDALSSGKVWLRAKADIVGYHRDAWAEAAFTGVGYDRKVSKSAETAGTPGYPNGAVKTEAATPRGAVTISEVMFDSAGGTLPQWIELYNASKTDALNLNRWELEIQNVDSEELIGRPIVRLTLQEKIIQPNQTLLIVTGNARASSADVYPADRVYNLLELHDKNLRIKKPSDTFLSATGFYLRLTDRNEHLVDEVGNTDGNRRTDDTPAWALPMPLSEVEGMRSSLIRRYDKGVARDGTEKSSWALAANFAKFKAEKLHYGHADDIGTPGYRQGGALPVELSSFTVTRVASGSVIVTWTTESEVDNAGFNLRRSLTRDSGFTLLNPVLIAGAGTTGERQTYTFIDTSAKPGVEHYYQIEEVSFGGKAETLVTRRLRGPVSPAHRALKTLGEVKQAK